MDKTFNNSELEILKDLVLCSILRYHKDAPDEAIQKEVDIYNKMTDKNENITVDYVKKNWLLN